MLMTNKLMSSLRYKNDSAENRRCKNYPKFFLFRDCKCIMDTTYFGRKFGITVFKDSITPGFTTI